MAALAVRSPYDKLIDYFFKLLRDDGFVEGDPQDELTVTRAISAVKTPQALAAKSNTGTLPLARSASCWQTARLPCQKFYGASSRAWLFFSRMAHGP